MRTVRTTDNPSCAVNDGACSAPGGPIATIPTTGERVCNTHYQRWYRLGDPRAEAKSLTRGAEIRRWVNEMLAADDDECWPWPFATMDASRLLDYKVGIWRGTTAPRAILTMKIGPPPGPDMHACHETDCEMRPLCVNPNHLYWGTVQENIDDQLDTGTRIRGERQWAAKLTEADVREIITTAGTAPELAERFGVKKEVIANIKAGKTWKHVDRTGLVPLRRKQKVTKEMAMAIIPDPRPQHIIAAEYGISASRVSNIKSGMIWPELDRSGVVRNQRGGPKSDLDEEKVLAILADHRPYLDIGADYGLSERAIYNIKRGKTWKQVDRSGTVRYAPGGGRHLVQGPDDEQDDEDAA